MGSTQRKENVDLLTPQQRGITNQTVEQIGPEFIQQLLGFVQGRSPEELQDVFQQAYVQPATQTFERQTIPAIMQAFGDANAGSSSALNQALSQSAADLSTSLGAQYGQLYDVNQARQMQALQQFSPFLSQQTFQPQFQQRQGILPGIISGAGQIGAGFLGGR